MTRLIKYLFREPLEAYAIPVKEARICSCDNVIRENTCPICGSKQQLFVGKILGTLKGGKK